MDLEKKLAFLTGADDEYSPLPKTQNAHTEYEIDMESDDDNEDDESSGASELSIDRYLRLGGGDSKSSKREKKKKKERSDLFDDFGDDDFVEIGKKIPKGIHSEKLYRKIVKRMPEEMIDDLEGFLNDDSVFDGEDSDELRNGLISIGRKYARDTSASAETSEIAKQYAASDEKLKSMYQEVSRDIDLLGKDIDQLRSTTRARNFKALSELISTKSSMHTTRLQVLKEMNAVTKAKFDMGMKERAAKTAAAGVAGGADISASTFKSLFGAGRDRLMSSIGGYGAVSGAVDADDYESNLNLTDEEIEERYFSDADDTEEEGDIVLRYEHLDPHYELLVDDAGKPMEIIAVDRDGNPLPDYPIPSMNGLSFNINSTTGEATDDFHRNYRIRQI